MTEAGPKRRDKVDLAFERERRRLLAMARRSGDQDVEDIVQDAFLKVVETSEREEIRSVDNLLSRVVRCLVIDRLRRKATRQAIMEPDAGQDIADPTGDPERTFIGNQKLQRIMATIDAMPSRRREVFLMHRIDDLTYPQIARQTGISIKGVEKHMRLALRQLAENDD